MTPALKKPYTTVPMLYTEINQAFPVSYQLQAYAPDCS
ncbi:hypothetical protein Mal35_21010 [Gimesia maris]|nr:hypothetical protein Mal35_21010 [Gimesia maris]